MKERTIQKIETFFKINDDLLFLKDNVMEACNIILNTYNNGGKLLVCGNGGSCSDADHIVGELMKGFLLKRPLDEDIKFKFIQYFGNEGSIIANKLQESLPAISLGVHSAFNTAYINDVDSSLIYAQQVIGYGKRDDTIIGISTSGNAVNVYYAFMAAKVKGLKCIALCGMDGGKISNISDCNLIAPSYETYRIQEYHVAIYHLICAVVESEIFKF
ncbi:D-sedoheptulose 7-phosphate isomerase [Caloramator quimbayensis]|uniref:D-sedoheptulose 7-phosphate isomerase n=1 Tax=Caloramator quimbayensis TaxID=1147123 RepID=A0A1T4YFZ2_9CLOT|nr:SIS domain-containing protein [Caloramator quimbayensis]SKB00508.1 D-sedoheptulose 7-phosphate isomerase [Caloramator quimbayensis]